MIKNIIYGGIGLLGLLLVPMLIENQSAGEILVIQYPNGNLKVSTEPGPQMQWFGSVTTYPRQKKYQFGVTEEGEAIPQGAIKLQFNDGGTGTLHGSVNWEMPIDEKSIIKIHKQFNSADSVEQSAVVKMMDAATYLAGPLMSSTESAGERRAELVNVINDQAERGVYVTHVKSVIKSDELSGETKTVNVTEIQRKVDGTPKRQQGSVLEDFNIKLQPISIKFLDYDDVVKKQIKDRQQSTTAVQLAIAQALKAEQDAITAEKNGMATAAEAKWKQETIKAQQVTEAQQKLEVATLATKEAEQYKQSEILRGQGEAERKRLILNADGALEKKLEALVAMNKDQWENIAKYQGNWVSNIDMSGNKTGTGSSGAQNLIDMLSVKTARDLNVDMAIPRK